MSKSLAENEDIIWLYTSREVFANLLEERTGLYTTHFKFLNYSIVMDYLIKEINELINKYNKEKHNLSFEICCSDSPYVGG